jgi:hypothetical protein
MVATWASVALICDCGGEELVPDELAVDVVVEAGSDPVVTAPAGP